VQTQEASVKAQPFCVAAGWTQARTHGGILATALEEAAGAELLAAPDCALTATAAKVMTKNSLENIFGWKFFGVVVTAVKT